MQEAAEVMKSSSVHHSRERSDRNQSRRPERWGSNVSGGKSQALETSVHEMGRPDGEDAETQPPVCLRAAARLADTVYVLTRSRRLISLCKPRRTASIPLPPISGSRAASGKVERTKTAQVQRQKSARPDAHGSRLPAAKLLMENTVCHALVTQGRKVNWELSKSNKISAAFGNKADIQSSETGGGLIKQTFDGHPPATSPPTQKTPDSHGPGADDRRTVMPVGAKHDASLPVTERQRDFCSDDSAIETQSEGSQDKGRLEGPEEGSDDEYYTEQRISEWVLKVNASLFSTGDEDLTTSNPVEEQDVATVKIVYSGD